MRGMFFYGQLILPMMKQGNFILEMYKTIDRKDSHGMVSFLTGQATFRFANLPAVQGNMNIESFLDGFFASIKAISHTDLQYWNSDDAWFVTGTVTYTRHDETTLSVPFGVLLIMEGHLINDYRIFVDASGLYR